MATGLQPMYLRVLESDFSIMQRNHGGVIILRSWGEYALPSQDETAEMANLVVGMFEVSSEYIGWVEMSNAVDDNLVLCTILLPSVA